MHSIQTHRNEKMTHSKPLSNAFHDVFYVLTRWNTVVDEISVDEMSAGEVS